MSDYLFYPWVRQGLGRALVHSFSDVQSKDAWPDAALDVGVQLADGSTATPTIFLLGASEVTGFDPRQVIRTDPMPFATNFEPNYFPLVEFDRPDFLWLFSPFRPEARQPHEPDASQQLLPWICLVVLEKRDGVLAAPHPRQPLPVLHVDNPSLQLPDPLEAWAWAHAQVVGSQPEILKAEAQANLSRLICPIRLEAGKQYVAGVVPLFQVGVLAGLGQDPVAADRLFAWAKRDGNAYAMLTEPLDLPVYYFWEFSTSAEGDFEALVRRLQRVESGDFQGTRPLAVGEDLAPFVPPGTLLALEGALTPHDPSKGQARPFDAGLAACQKALLRALTPTLTKPPIVRPPVYGCWQAGRGRGLPADLNDTPWLAELNLDPTLRVSAGVGTQVVQDQQEQLMASAWEQVGEIEAANQLLRQAQLAREASNTILSRRLHSLDTPGLLAVTQPVHSRVTIDSGQTLHGKLHEQDYNLPPAAASAAFRRTTRPRGPLARRARAAEGWTGKLINGLNNDTLKVVPRDQGGGKLELDGSFTVDRINGLNSEEGDALLALWQALPHPDSGGEPRRHDLEYYRRLIEEKLDPEITIAARWREPRIIRPRGWQSDDPIEPVMAAPDFPQPMYQALRDISPDLLLPGIQNVPNESITALYANPRFIEAYMVGLNHEMSRELLWRGYPTDQRGTYFRRFWDTSSQIFVQAEPPRDIPPIADWGKTELGDHLDRTDAEQGQVILLIRGQLLMRYPRTTIYLLKAVEEQRPDPTNPGKMITIRVPRDPSVPPEHPDFGKQRLDPIFMGPIPPDMTFFGFNKSGADLRGKDSDPGWFFVLQQPPTELRFGLDVEQPVAPAQLWSDLSQQDIVWHKDKEEHIDNPHIFVRLGLKAEFTVDDTRTLKKACWSLKSSSAHFAYMTLQAPVRVAIHVDDLLAE